MDDWRSLILNEFIPGLSRLTLVFDPDRLLLEEKLISSIKNKGFELIIYEDSISFRYIYEQKFRSKWDKGEIQELVVIVHKSTDESNSLPYDLLSLSRKLSFNLVDIFKGIDANVLRAVDRADLDILYEALSKYCPRELGENASIDFILKHVYELDQQLIKTPSHLICALIRIHYNARKLHPIFIERLVKILQQSEVFSEWPLEILFADRKSFFEFLQERWPIFIDRLAKASGGFVNELSSADSSETQGTTRSSLRYPGPGYLPFEHNDIRVYIDNLFYEGLLKPIRHERAEQLKKTWVAPGIVFSSEGTYEERIQALINSIDKKLPSVNAYHDDWLRFSFLWAEFINLEYKCEKAAIEKYKSKIKEIKTKVDNIFFQWVLNRYASLYNIAPSDPVMVHHIPRYIARGIENGRKAAFIVIDGLSLAQWFSIKDMLIELDPSYEIDERGIFAWIPTITSVSRQAMFAAKPPLFLLDGLFNTSKESNYWIRFWEGRGLKEGEAEFLRVNGDDSDLEEIRNKLSLQKLKVIGLVINKVDDIMHGMELGAAGMHSQIVMWIKNGFLNELIDILLKREFVVYLSSDHGNVEAIGIGEPKEGSIAETKGKRVRIYSDNKLRSLVKNKFPTAIEWEPIGLPDDYLPLIAPSRTAFVKEGNTIVSHGGLCLEEIIVPFVKISKEFQ